MPALHQHVLQLDIQGTPQAWIAIEHAATHHAAGAVPWFEGSSPLRAMRGGWNVAEDRQSRATRHGCRRRRG